MPQSNVISQPLDGRGKDVSQEDGGGVYGPDPGWEGRWVACPGRRERWGCTALKGVGSRTSVHASHPPPPSHGTRNEFLDLLRPLGLLTWAYLYRQ